MKLKNITTVLIFAFTLMTTPQVFSQEKVDRQNNSEMVQKTYKLKGFKQSCCTGIVEYSLKEVKGYIKSKANVKQQELTVWYNPTLCKEKAIKDAINKTAYKIID